MLLSFYASFRWARSEHYVLKMTVFIIVASFFSAVIGSSFAWILFGPLPFLSFPFYAIRDEMHGSPVPPEGWSFWIPTYRIRFLTAEVSSLKAHDFVEHVGGSGWSYQLLGYNVTFVNMEIGYIDKESLGSYPLTFPFLFFLLVNVAGALLGFWISKIHMFQKSEWEWTSMGFLSRVALGLVLIGVGIWLSTFGVATTVRIPPWTGDYVTTTIYPYQEDALVFVIFGITWLAIILLEFAWESNL